MNRPTCPFLGMKDDPTTALSFPSEGNHCHRARPVSPVNRGYQQQYCLTPDHRACPLYQAARPVPIPPAIAGPVEARPPSRQMALLMALPLLIVGIVVAALLITALGADGPQPDVIPDTGPQIDNNWLLGGSGSETNTPFTDSQQGQPVPEEKADCPLPGGWMAYIVNPTDSLYRLSVIYGVPVEQLQSINCLGDSTAILPGDVIYVPYIPTNTAVPGLLPTASPLRGTIRPPVIQPAQPQPTRAPGSRQSDPTNTPFPTLAPQSTSTSILPTTALLPTQTSTQLPTSTLAPSSTTAPTSTARPSSTPRPTNTATPEPTRTRRPSHTPRPRDTNTPIPTNTFPPTNTPEPTFTPQPTNTLPPTEPPPTEPPPTEPVPTDPPLPTEPPFIGTLEPPAVSEDPVMLTIADIIETIADAFTGLFTD